MAHSIQNLRSSGVLQPTHSGGMDAAAQGRHGRHSINLGKPQMRLPQASAGGQAHAPLHQRNAPTQLPKAVHILKASPQAQQALQTTPAGPQLQDRERMIGSDQLKTRMKRDPKQNVRLFGIIGPRIWPRGTTYRNVVNQLADYRQATGNMPIRTKVEDRRPDIAQLDARLAKLDRGNVTNLKGVDNDICFGKRSNDPKSLTTKELPRLIDSQTAQRIKGMAQHWHDQPGGMKETLSELLSPEEVAAAEKRLFATQARDGFKGLLEHIGELEQPAGNPARAKGVVPHGQWGVWTAPDTGKSAYETLTAPGAGPGSYVRVLELQQQQQKQKFG